MYDSRSKVHLYDLVEPDQHFTAQQFSDAAAEATLSVFAKSRPPVFFGGASMYAEWFFFGEGSNPVASREQVAVTEAELRSMQSWESAFAVAASLDAAGARLVLPNDYYRLARLVMVMRHQAVPSSVGGGYKEPRLALDLRGAFVFPRNREALYRSLDRRCEKMLADGLLEETLAIMERFPDALPRKIATVVGYRQCFEFLQGTANKPISVDAFVKFLLGFQAATRTYARRQMTYFRHSEKLSGAFCVMGALPSQESAEEVTGQLQEIFEMSREEYDRDKRWRRPIPVADAKENMRAYATVQECFHSREAIIKLLSRVEEMRHVLAVERARKRNEGNYSGLKN